MTSINGIFSNYEIIANCKHAENLGIGDEGNLQHNSPTERITILEDHEWEMIEDSSDSLGRVAQKISQMNISALNFLADYNESNAPGLQSVEISYLDSILKDAQISLTQWFPLCAGR